MIKFSPNFGGFPKKYKIFNGFYAFWGVERLDGYQDWKLEGAKHTIF